MNEFTAPRATLLLIDDEPANLQILRHTLQQDYRLLFAKDGVKALELAQRDLPDLILLDIMMPDMDGYEVARRIRQQEDLPYIPIIVVTARDSTEDKVTGLDAGADDYLTKPINFPELEARVRSMLRIKKLQDELDYLRTAKRQEVANRLHEAMEGGELIENAEYEAAKNEQAFVEGRIQELEMLLATAKIIDENGRIEKIFRKVDTKRHTEQILGMMNK